MRFAHRSKGDDRDQRSKTLWMVVMFLIILAFVLLFAWMVFATVFPRGGSFGASKPNNMWEDPRFALPSYVYNRR